MTSWNLEIPELLELLSSRSLWSRATWHPLGFVHLEIEATPDHAIRMHLWPPMLRIPKNPNWPIHSHVFDLRSKVLAGSLTNVSYLYKDVLENESTNQLFQVKYFEGGSRLLPSGRFVRLVESSEVVIRQGEHYSVPAGAFHETRVSTRDLVLTLAQTVRAMQGEPFVVGNVLEADTELGAYIRRPVDPHELKGWLELALREA